MKTFEENITKFKKDIMERGYQPDSNLLARRLFACLDEGAIQERSKEIPSVTCCNPYQRQESALKQQLSQFLGALSPPRTVISCTANDIVKFLIPEDKSGRTEVH